MTGTPSAEIDQLARVMAITGDLIDGIRPDQWAAATPCTAWTVRELVNHLVTGNLFFIAILGDQQVPDRAADHLGDDPPAAYRSSTVPLLAAFAQPGVADRIYQAPIGPTPGAALVHLRITEQLVHGWDIAQATGRRAEFPDDVAEQELAISRRMLSGVPRAGRFGPAHDLPADAPAIDRLAGLLGHRPLPAGPE
jgi:uncharacterized protein (TIGR03086 family)